MNEKEKEMQEFAESILCNPERPTDQEIYEDLVNGSPYEDEEEPEEPQETAADVVAAIKEEKVIPAVLAYEICKKVEQIVQKFCRGLNSDRAYNDFRNYDIQWFHDLRPSDFPVIYGMGQGGTSFYAPSKAGKNIFLFPSEPYRVARHGISDYVNRCKSAEKWTGYPADLYCINYDEKSKMLTIDPMNAEQADNVCKDAYIPWYERYKTLVGLPTDLRMGIEFNNISFSRLRQLLTDPTSLPQVPTWYETPKTVGESLRNIIHRIRNYDKRFSGHKYTLTWSERDKTFYFNEHNPNAKHPLNGGIVYHGSPAEGYNENGSVQMERTYGWSMHT